MPPAAAAAQLRVCTLNVRGLSSSKLQALLSWAWGERYDLVFLLECWHTGRAPDPVAWFRQQQGCDPIWGGRWFASSGTSRQGGILALVRPSAAVDGWQQVQPPEPEAAEAQGRVLRLDATVSGQPVTFIGVYAPSQPAERSPFFTRTLPACLPAAGSRLLLMGGDWNCVLDPLDVVGREEGADLASRGRGAPDLAALMAAHSLHDVWRHQHPALSDFTHFHMAGQAGGSGARLDRWLLSGRLLQWQPDACIVPTRPVDTDHLPVDLTLQPAGAPIIHKPPWRLPIGLLGDTALRAVWDASLRADAQAHTLALQQQPLPPSYHRHRWLRIKEELAHQAQAHARELSAARRDRQRAQRLGAQQARLALADAARSPLTSPALLRAAGLLWEAATAPPAQAQVDSDACLAAGRLLDHLYGGRSTYFFHNHPVKERDITTVAHLRIPPAEGIGPDSRLDLSRVAHVPLALQAFAQHYSADAPAGVYRSRPPDPAARQQLLATLPRRLTPRQAGACEGPQGGLLTLACLEHAVRQSQRNKAPGADGLPIELYLDKDLWPLLGPCLLAAFNEAFAAVGEAAPLARFLEGIMALVGKPAKARDIIKGFRPITLLDLDVRIVCLVVAHRLQLPLDLLIDATQSAFLAGRDISDNVLFHLALADWLRERHQGCWLLLLDLAGAYDNVDWGLLSDTMLAMGFQQHGHVRWAQLLHCGASSRIQVNGFLSDPFPLRSGLLQGSGASPLFWVIALQPLSSYLCSLQAQGRLRTPVLPRAALAGGPVAPAHADPTQDYADDITAAVESLEEDGPVVWQAFALYAAAGGPQLAGDGKSVHLRLGAPAPPPPPPPIAPQQRQPQHLPQPRPPPPPPPQQPQQPQPQQQ